MTRWTFRKDPESQSVERIHSDCFTCLVVIPPFALACSLVEGGRPIPLGPFMVMMSPFVLGLFLSRGRLMSLARKHGGFWDAGGFQDPL